MATWIQTIHWVLAKPSKENWSDSTLLAPSQSMAIGGGVGRNGMAVRSMGPQYARFMPGSGPGWMKKT